MTTEIVFAVAFLCGLAAWVLGAKANAPVPVTTDRS
jgi:hypothetical protein